MLIREGGARDQMADLRLAGSLAGVAGALNAAGFYAADLYSSNMTGNVSAFASHIALAHVAEAAVYLALVAVFIMGAAASTLLFNAGRRRGVVRIYALSVMTEAVLLAVVAVVGLLATGRGSEFVLAYGLSFLMGLQNAVVTRISDARVRTTHVTGMVTDIGMELGNLADAAWRRSAPDGGAANRQKLRLHAITVACFVLGGIIGVVAFRAIGPACLLLAASVLFALALPGFVERAGGKPSDPAGLWMRLRKML